ncbi:MAG: spermidine synthase, partial [Candidatus Saccharimonadales bacterium]
VEELIYDGRQSRVLFSGPMHSAQSGLAIDDNPRLLFDYIQQLYELADELRPKTILLLGGGTLTLPTALLKLLPEAVITAVEINPSLIRLAKDYFGYIKDPRLNVEIDDATHFIANAKKKYELIITDLYNDLAIPDPFLSLSFARQLRRVLAPNGLVATNCISALSGNGSFPMTKLAEVYKEAIGRVRAIRVDKRHYMNWTPQNLLILSGSGADSVLTGLSEVQLEG